MYDNLVKTIFYKPKTATVALQSIWIKYALQKSIVKTMKLYLLGKKNIKEVWNQFMYGVQIYVTVPILFFSFDRTYCHHVNVPFFSGQNILYYPSILLYPLYLVPTYGTPIMMGCETGNIIY